MVNREYDIGSEDDSGWNHLIVKVNSLGQVQWTMKRGWTTLTGYWDAKMIEKLRTAIEEIDDTINWEAASHAETRIQNHPG